MGRVLPLLTALISLNALAAPFTGNDTRSAAMGNTGVASADSFAASQFNPALLSTFSDDVDFGLQLPSLRTGLDDGYGFGSSTAFVRDFQNVSTNTIANEVAGNFDTLSLTQAITNVQTAADFSDGAEQQELDDFAEANAVLTNKIDIINTEMNDLNNAVKGANSALSTAEDKPYAILASIGAAAAKPSKKLGLALHLNSTVNIGFLSDVAQSDLDKITAIVTATSGYVSEAQQLSQLSTNLSNAAATFNTFNTSVDPCSSGDSAYINAYDNLLIAQAKLDAESDGSDKNVTLCNGSTSTQTPIGSTNLNNYNSDDGIYLNGNLQQSATEGLGEDSSITLLGVNLIELGISAAKEVDYRGQTFAIGITPKIQIVKVYQDTYDFLDNESENAGFLDNSKTTIVGNLDLGVAKNWDDVLDGQVRAGAVIKDLIPYTLESVSGLEIQMSPKVRLGAAHKTRFSTLALDLDLTRNKPLGYGSTTQYLGIGAELDAFNWAKLRLGYRNNLAISNLSAITTGIGITPFGVGLDLSGWFVPSSDEDRMFQDFGLATQFSINW